jgi:hypothetical protein
MKRLLVAIIALSIHTQFASAYCTISNTSPFTINDGVSSWSLVDSNGFALLENLGSLGSGLVPDLNENVGGNEFFETQSGDLLIVSDDGSFAENTLVRGSEVVTFSGSCTETITTSENIISASEWWEIQVMEYVVMILVLGLSSFFFIFKIAR